MTFLEVFRSMAMQCVRKWLNSQMASPGNCRTRHVRHYELVHAQLDARVYHNSTLTRSCLSLQHYDAAIPLLNRHVYQYACPERTDPSPVVNVVGMCAMHSCRLVNYRL